MKLHIICSPNRFQQVDKRELAEKSEASGENTGVSTW